MFQLFKRKINPLTSGKIQQKNFLKKLKFRNDGGLILIDVNIEHKNYIFMLDTGAFSVVPSSFLELNILTKYDEIVKTVDASGHIKELELYKLKNLNIQEIEFQNFSVIVDDFTQQFPLSCLKFDGILGYNFLQNIILSIDYQHSFITLSDTFLKPKLSKIIKLKIGENNAPEFQLQVDKKSYWIGLDTGKNDGLMIGNEELIQTLQKRETFIERITGTFSSDFNGVNKHSFIDKYLLENFTIDKKILIKSYIIFHEKNSLNIAGNEFLANFKMTVDLKRKKLYLESIKDDIQENYKKSFGFLTFWSEEKKLFISAITQDTPAYNSKLKIGDKIMSINELDTLGFSKEEYCKHSLLSKKVMLYSEDDTELSIIVKRDGKLIREKLSLSL